MKSLHALFEEIGVNRAVLALSIARLGDGIGNSILFIIIPLYISALPAPLFPFPETVRSGILIAAFGIVAGISQPFTGALVDYLNRRKLFVVGGLLFLAAATVGVALSPRYIYALIFRALQGLGLAASIPATMALLTDSTRRETRGGAMGFFSTFRVGSLAVGPLLGGFVYGYFGFDAAFFTGAAFMLIGAGLVSLWVQEKKSDDSEKHKRKFKLFTRDMFTTGMLPLGFAVFTMAGSFALIAPLEQQFNARLNQAAATFGLAFSALMVTRILVQIPIGHFSDRRGRKRLIVWGLVLMAVSTAPIGLVTQTWQLIGLRILQGIASGAIASPAFALAGDLAKSGGEGRHMSIVTMGFGFGIALGSLSAGLLAVYFLDLPFLVFGVFGLTAAWLVNLRVTETVS